MAQRISDCALFHGDVPVVHRSFGTGRLFNKDAAGKDLNFTLRRDWVIPRPLEGNYDDVLYSPDGTAWSQGRVDPFLSVRDRPEGGFLKYLRLKARAKTLNEGTIIQGQHPYTYGDWVSEQLRSLSLAEKIVEPVLLPASMASRKYVFHEMKRLGLSFLEVDQPVSIRKAMVLHKPQPRTYWSEPEVEKFRSRLGHNPVIPKAGSILFLSRAGVVSEQPDAVRVYNSELTQRVVEGLGGKTVRTEGMNMDDYMELAPYAETVLADHGAAMFNILHWNARSIIELVPDNWWCNGFVFLARACGVNNYAVLRYNARTEEETAAMIERYIRAYQAESDTNALRVSP